MLPAGWRPDEDTVDVVVVEDDDVVADLLEEALKTRGHRVRRFTAVDAAVDALGDGLEARLGCSMDLPGLEGLSVLRHLADGGVLRQSRVIMLAARAEEDEAVEALELGATGHVTKPFSMPVLMQKVRRALAEPGR